MWPAQPKPDPELLTLFEESALDGALDDIVDFADEAADQLGLYEAPSSPPTSSRSTGSSTRATGSGAPPSPACSRTASTR